MHGPEQVRAAVARHLDRCWRAEVLGVEGSSFPKKFSTRLPSSMAASFGEVDEADCQWRSVLLPEGSRLVTTNRRCAGLTVELTSGVEFDTMSAAARWVGGGWPQRLVRATSRIAELRDRGLAVTEPSQVRALEAMSELDHRVLVEVCAWWSTVTPAELSGLSSRQIPVPGVDGKWIERYSGLVMELTGVRANLVSRPAWLHLTYVDPDHLAAGGRRLEGIASTDPVSRPPYDFDTVFVVENRECALYFPETSRAVVLEGGGAAALSLVSSMPWIVEAPRIIYWGDMDATGYAILSTLRKGLDRPVESMMMDRAIFDGHEHLGVRCDHRGQEVGHVFSQAVYDGLFPEEKAVYSLITSVDHRGALRVEQERISISTVRKVCLAVIDGY